MLLIEEKEGNDEYEEEEVVAVPKRLNRGNDLEPEQKCNPQLMLNV